MIFFYPFFGSVVKLEDYFERDFSVYLIYWTDNTYPIRSHNIGRSGGGGHEKWPSRGGRSNPVGSGIAGGSNPAATSSQPTGVYGSQSRGGGSRQPRTYLFVQSFTKTFYLNMRSTSHITTLKYVVHGLWLQCYKPQPTNQVNVKVPIPRALARNLCIVWPCLVARPSRSPSVNLKVAKRFWVYGYNNHAGNTLSFFQLCIYC